jgi:lysozyme
MNIEKLLKIEEGLSLKIYKCPAGFNTIGVGRNLDANGIREDEAMVMLRNDIYDCTESALKIFPNFSGMNIVRADTVISMIFQLGEAGFLKFKNTIFLIKQGRFEEASEQMLKSKWAKQTPERAKRHAEMMRTGIWDSYYK